MAQHVVAHIGGVPRIRRLVVGLLVAGPALGQHPRLDHQVAQARRVAAAQDLRGNRLVEQSQIAAGERHLVVERDPSLVDRVERCGDQRERLAGDRDRRQRGELVGHRLRRRHVDLCAPGQHCQNGTCACDGLSCPTGCCRNNVCESPASNPDAGATALLALCGKGGRACTAFGTTNQEGSWTSEWERLDYASSARTRSAAATIACSLPKATSRLRYSVGLGTKRVCAGPCWA